MIQKFLTQLNWRAQKCTKVCREFHVFRQHDETKQRTLYKILYKKICTRKIRKVTIASTLSTLLEFVIHFSIPLTSFAAFVTSRERDVVYNNYLTMICNAKQRNVTRARIVT